MFRSLYFDQNEILAAIKELHCPVFDADISYGNGGFWRQLERPAFCSDIEPLDDFVVRADSRCLPLENDNKEGMVFDPPFMTYISNSRQHKEGKMKLSARFGGYYSYDELTDHYKDTLKECGRVLKKNGKLIFKVQDIVHNHRLHLTHVNTINWAAEKGLRLIDLFILAANHRMPGPQKGKQRHARIFHSYFLVFNKL